MKTRFVLAALLGGLTMMTACNKENTNEQLGIPEGALMLTTEDYVGDGKTAVEDAAVEWVNGDKVMVNGDEYTVTVIDAGAYINGGNLSDPLYGYYACGTVANGQSATPSVNIPSTYTCRYVDGKQVIALPMAAYTASVGSVIPFKHLTAAVKVRVWNAIENTTLVVDRVVVKSSSYLLSKEGKAIGLANGVPTVAPESSNGAENSVTVNIKGNTTIASNSILDVQVPILPIGSGDEEELTIEVYTYDAANIGHTYTFSFTDGVPQGLERNAMLTAGCKIHTGEGNHVNEFDALNTPLTFEAKTASVEVYFNGNSSYPPSLEYSTDGGTNWATYTSGTHITLAEAGDKVSFRGDNTTVTRAHNLGNFGSTGDCYLYGNVMSLLSSSDYSTLTRLPCDRVFMSLFVRDGNHPIAIYNHPYKTLVLPATTLTRQCYWNMFAGSEHLTAAPALPATTLATNCYRQMFLMCSSLTEAPDLPATVLVEGCYQCMFQACTSLTEAPDLSGIRTLATNCCEEMFANCSTLTTAPALAPASAELKESCYQAMFKDCTSLTTAPDLPANFTGRVVCTNAYKEMFSGCTSLNSVKCYATMLKRGLSAPPTTDWLSGVVSSGTFHTPASVDFTWSTDASGIPSGWTVENDL